MRVAQPCLAKPSAFPTDSPILLTEYSSHLRTADHPDLCMSLFQCLLYHIGKVSASTINAKKAPSTSSFSASLQLFSLFFPETKFVLNFCELSFGQKSSMPHSWNKDRKLCGFSEAKKQNVTVVFTFQCLGQRLGRSIVSETYLF